MSAFACDGRSLFLSSGERQRFTPVQDPNEPLGKILLLTLEGQPAPGNPWTNKVCAATRHIADPPEDAGVAKGATGRSFRWSGINRTRAAS